MASVLTIAFGIALGFLLLFFIFLVLGLLGFIFFGRNLTRNFGITNIPMLGAMANGTVGRGGRTA